MNTTKRPAMETCAVTRGPLVEMGSLETCTMMDWPRFFRTSCICGGSRALAPAAPAAPFPRPPLHRAWARRRALLVAAAFAPPGVALARLLHGADGFHRARRVGARARLGCGYVLLGRLVLGIVVVALVIDEVGVVQEGALVGANVDECRLQARQHRLDLSPVDVADHPPCFRTLDLQLNELVVLENRNAHFALGCADQDFSFHRITAPNAREGDRTRAARRRGQRVAWPKAGSSRGRPHPDAQQSESFPARARSSMRKPPEPRDHSRWRGER